MFEKKTFFSEDGTRKFVAVGYGNSLQGFSLGLLYSSKEFCSREYFPKLNEQNGWALVALHTHKNQKIAVSVWQTLN